VKRNAAKSEYSMGSFLNSVNYTKINIFKDLEEFERGVAEKEYGKLVFVINRTLSYSIDTLMYANELNQRSVIPPKSQFDYLLNSLRKRKRYNRWARRPKIENLALVKEYFSYNDIRAEEILDLLSEDDFIKIRKNMYKGGKKK